MVDKHASAKHMPLIGVTGRRKKADQVKGMPEILNEFEGDWYFAGYAQGVLEAGGLPVHLPQGVDPLLFADYIDGVLLSGGADIGPETYGAVSETDDFPPEPSRDAFELTLLGGAAERSMPVLGICRGLQMLNVFAGGTLHQHVPSHAKFDIAPSTLSHSVQFSEGSMLAGLYGDSMDVNSLHHQTVDQLGADLSVTATSAVMPEGQATADAIEGLEHQSLPMVAVQWHPEMLGARSTDPIFKWLIDQANAYRDSSLTNT